MPRCKAEDFICLRTYTVTLSDPLCSCISRGSMGKARELFFNEYLTEAQRTWLKTVQHWYIGLENNWAFPPQVQLKIKRREQNRNPDNILLGLLLFS